jgi:glycosyltransferase involved in cell wall biosynthesis
MSAITKKPASLAIMYNNFGPYHLVRLAAMTKFGRLRGLSVLGIELASQEFVHPWLTPIQCNQLNKFTVIPDQAIEEVPARRLIRGLWSLLNELNPQALAMGLSKQTTHALIAALIWARLKNRITIGLIDSKFDDYQRNSAKEWVKKRIYSLFDTALVGGTYSREYTEFLGIPRDKIFLGCDVVDNDYFARQADYSRENSFRQREKYGLPENYYLCVSRIDGKKNIVRMLEAYELYRKTAKDRAWHLVICGSGPMESELQLVARDKGLQVIFAGFTQIVDLPAYYGLARCLIFPSLGDTWGLVVNEAMASGLPVLVSKACGCAPDLVQKGVNGYIFDPYDVCGLAQLMLKMSSGELNLEGMGQVSRKIISNWSLETYAHNLFKAMKAGSVGKQPLFSLF